MGKICAGIVLYNPDPDRLRKNIESVREQVDEVFLVDNGSENLPAIREMQYPNVVLLENGENLGIAAALNRACREAATKGYEWILTLDDDTVSPEGMVREMGEVSWADDVGIVCPAVWYEGWLERPEEREGAEEITACMTSGSLTRLAAWEKVGGFREDFFIDFVDNEFCQKLREAGYRILRVHRCVMRHSLGEVRTVRIPLAGERKYAVHAPWRFYYMIRNNIVFVKEHRAQLNVHKEWAKVFYIAFSGWMHSPEKKATRKYIRMGRKDAKAGKMGRLGGER